MSEQRKIYDERGRLLEEGDVLEVFHFVGRGRKHHYMYKIVDRRADSTLFIRHLGKTTPGESSGYPIDYMANADGVVTGTLIIQSDNWEKLEKRRKGAGK